MKVYKEIVFDIDGKIVYEDSYEYSGDVMLMQGNCASQCTQAYSHSQYAGDMCIQHCEDLEIDPNDEQQEQENQQPGEDTNFPSGSVTCTDGTTANSLAECPQLVDYQADIGYEAQGEFIDDLTTPEDESMRDYAEDFPTWTGSESALQSDLIESKLGMLPELMDLSKRGSELESETSRLQAGTQLEGVLDSREAMIRAGGGMRTGQSEDKVQSVYDRVLSGFDLQQEGIDIKRESSLFDFEGRRLDYQMDLSIVKQDFQDRMWDLISLSLDKYKGCDDPPCDDDRNDEYDGGTSVTDEQDDEQDLRDEDRDQDDRDDDRDDEYDDRDYWDEDGMYS